MLRDHDHFGDGLSSVG